MAQTQRKIKPAIKYFLVNEAGGKCANPGCSNWRVHVHHIKHWAVYKTHASSEMIAICPSCHDAAHHGQIKITDDVLFLWKGITRPVDPEISLIYVEPSSQLRLLTGTICIASENDEAVVFELSNSNHLKLRVLDRDLLQVSVRLQDQKGRELLRVVENHVRVMHNKEVLFESRPGRARVTVPAANNFVPAWLIDQVRARDPEFGADNRIVMLDIEVLKPGLLRVQGCWPDGNVGVVITAKALSFCTRGLREPVSMVGAGEDTVLMFTGSVTSALFGF